MKLTIDFNTDVDIETIRELIEDGSGIEILSIEEEEEEEEPLSTGEQIFKLEKEPETTKWKHGK